MESTATRETNWSRRIFWLLVGIFLVLFVVMPALAFIASQTLRPA